MNFRRMFIVSWKNADMVHSQCFVINNPLYRQRILTGRKYGTCETGKKLYS